MKTFMSMIAVAGAVSTKQRLSSQLDLVIGELQKLHDDYSVALDNTTTTNAAFQTTCSMEQATMEQTIDAAKKRSSNLQMQAQTAQEGHLVAKHNAETAGSQLEMQTSAQEKATEIRGAEKAEYTPKKQQCTETIDALRNTKNHLSSQMSAGSFLDMKKVSPKVRSLLQQEPSMDNFDLGDADAGSQSALKKINDIVLSLYDDWSKECDELTQTELTSQQNYDLNTQQFGHQKSMLENEIKQETAVAAEQQAAMTQANADNQATLKQIDSVQNEMKASKTECVRVDNESNERAQELRTAIQAVVTAVDKLSQRRASFVEVATSLLQIRTLSTDNDVRTRVSDSLMKTAKSFDNKDISNLAMQVKAVGLDKVATMIREMITRLQQQAHDEKDFEQQCVEAIAGLEQDLETHQSSLNRQLNSKEQCEAEIDQLSATIEESTAALSARTEQNAQKEAVLLEQISLLKVDLDDVKTTAGVIAEVLQEFEGQLSNPALSAAAEPVVSVLQVVLTNTQGVQTETQAALTTTQGDLKAEKHDFEIEKTQLETTLNHAQQGLSQQQVNLQNYETEIANSQELVDTKEEALTSKKTICNGGTREDKHARRTQAREEEIEQLQQALQILENQ